MNLLDLAVKITVDDSGVDNGLNKILVRKGQKQRRLCDKDGFKNWRSCYHSRNSVNRGRCRYRR